jgi:glycosyltransferase involved in cell wall biosynthesis
MVFWFPEMHSRLHSLPRKQNKDLKNIVFVWYDMSRIGGISGRIERTVACSSGRSVNYYCISSVKHHALDSSWNIHAADLLNLQNDIADWTPQNTVVIFQNTVIRALNPDVVSFLRKFPTMHMYAGQLSWFLQDTKVALDVDFIENYSVNRLITFSQQDALSLRQFDLHGACVLPPSIAVKSRNAFRAEKNTRIGFVGRIDFHTKAADRLIPIALALRDAGLPPLKVFTTDRGFSPDLQKFIALIEENDAHSAIEMVLDCTDKDAIYKDLKLLLLPSKKESFGNVILEAFSYGVPVLACSYCPGPAEIIEHEVSGFLLDDFEVDTVSAVIRKLTKKKLSLMSAAAFARHREFEIVTYMERLERLAEEAIENHSLGIGFRVYPVLALHGPRKTEASPRQQVTKKQDKKVGSLEFDLGRLVLRAVERPSRIFKLPFKVAAVIKRHKQKKDG